METRIGWLPGETSQPPAKKPNQMVLLFIGLFWVLLCLCVGVAVVIYSYPFG